MFERPSPRKGEKFAGVTVALITPFRNGEVDYDALRRLVDWHVEQGTDCIAPVGTTGESPTLSHEEHERVIAAVVEHAAGRITVMAGTGSNSTSEALRLTTFAARAGADGALMVSPYYNKPNQEGIYRHFAAIAEAVDLPIVVYNIPGRTGRNIEPETLRRLAEIPNIVAVKEASGSLDQVSRLAIETNLTILSGDDTLTLPMLAVGGSGVISVLANIAPQQLQRMIEAYQDGRVDEAKAIHQRLFPLAYDLLNLSVNPVPIKAAMQLLGRDTGELRLPLVPLEGPALERLRRRLEEVGLLEAQAAGR